MSEIAVRVENLSKLYKIGARQNRHDTLRDHLVYSVASLFSRNGHDPTGSAQQAVSGGPSSSFSSQPVGSSGQTSAVDGRSDIIWALKDVSFEIKHGDAVGFVGRNGAGKSTLLKILSRITEPTTGRAEIYGRVGSLLEVGTGFHPELTGRENVFLNGAILGMRKAEIERKFDEIVAFSEIETFIDTPVKRYSSGMRVRLAFSVAAHLEPEILIVDEVLAVGDTEFQKKCLGKMDDVTKEGRTVLFVSHNLAALRRLCNQGLLLDRGQATCYDSVDNCVARYDQMMVNGSAVMSAPHVLYESRSGNKNSQFEIKRLEILDCEGKPKNRIFTWDSFVIRVIYEAQRGVVGKGAVVIVITTPDGTPLLYLSNQPDCAVSMDIEIGQNVVDCSIKRVPLSAGEYHIRVGLVIPHLEWLLKLETLGRFEIGPRDVFNSGLSPTSARALLAIPHDWRVR
jgi:homopolymeric O-antigen transport system ATP-binding protein